MSISAFSHRSSTERILIHALVIVLALPILFPSVRLVIMSFKTTEDIVAFPPKLFFTPTLAADTALWSSSFATSFANSAVVSVTSTLLALAVGVPGANALSRTPMRQEKALSLMVLASRMAPPIAFAIPYFLAYRWAELLDTCTGLVIIDLTFNISLVVWLMRSFFDATPRSLDETAWIDGASLWQGFTKIILPISGPGIAAAMTTPVAVVDFMNYEGWEWGKIAAGGTMVMLPVLVFSIAVRKFFIHSMTAGAFKE